MTHSRFPINEDFLAALEKYSASGRAISSIEPSVCVVILDYINANKAYPQRLNLTNHSGSHTLLSAAVQNGDWVLFEMLIEIPEIVNSSGYEGLTPLMWAILHGNERMVAALLNSPFINVNAEVTKKDGELVSALSCAIKTANPQMVELLMEKGVSFDADELCQKIEEQLHTLRQQEVAVEKEARKAPDLIFRKQMENNVYENIEHQLEVHNLQLEKAKIKPAPVPHIPHKKLIQDNVNRKNLIEMKLYDSDMDYFVKNKPAQAQASRHQEADEMKAKIFYPFETISPKIAERLLLAREKNISSALTTMSAEERNIAGLKRAFNLEMIVLMIKNNHSYLEIKENYFSVELELLDRKIKNWENANRETTICSAGPHLLATTEKDFFTAVERYIDSEESISSIDSLVASILCGFINTNFENDPRLFIDLMTAAIKKGDKFLFDILFDMPELENIPDKNGLTPLMVAASHHEELMVQKLLNKPTIDINAKTADGKSAFHFAVINGFGFIAACIIQKGGDYGGSNPSNENVKFLENKIKELLSKDLTVETLTQIINFNTLLVMIRDKINLFDASKISTERFAAQMSALRLVNPETSQYFRFYQNQMDGKSNLASSELGVSANSHNQLDKKPAEKPKKEVDDDNVLNEDSKKDNDDFSFGNEEKLHSSLPVSSIPQITSEEKEIKSDVALSPYDPFVERPDLPIRNRSNLPEIRPVIWRFEKYIADFAIKQRELAIKASKVSEPFKVPCSPIAKMEQDPVFLPADDHFTLDKDESWAKPPLSSAQSFPAPLDLSYLPSYRSEMSFGGRTPTTPSLVPAYSSSIPGFTSFGGGPSSSSSVSGFTSFGMPDVTDERTDSTYKTSPYSPANTMSRASSDRLFKPRSSQSNECDLPKIAENSDEELNKSISPEKSGPRP